MKRLYFVIFIITVCYTNGASAKTPSEVYELASMSTVIVKTYNSKGVMRGFGSGVFLPDGTVATNCHVISNAERLVVRFKKKEYQAKTKYTDWERDTCTIVPIGLKAKPVELGTTQGLRVGTRVYAIGSPKGFELTFSEGIVSSLREVDGGKYIQITSPISPGSSGGGLFDKNGKLLGLTSFYVAEGQNLNFAIPVEWIKELPVRHMISKHSNFTLLDWINRSTVLQEKKDWERMIVHCRRWAEAMPNESFSWFSLAIAHAGSGQTAEAIVYCKKSLSIKPSQAEAWYCLGVFYDEIGQRDKAIEGYAHAIRIDPDFSNAWFDLGVAYYVSEEWEKAIAAYRHVVDINPDAFDAWSNLGAVYRDSGKVEKAIEAYEQALRINPNYENAWQGLGSAYFQALDWEKAIEPLHQTLRINPDNASAWYILGICYRGTGQSTKKVTEVYRHLKELDSKLAEDFFNKIIKP